MFDAQTFAPFATKHLNSRHQLVDSRKDTLQRWWTMEMEQDSLMKALSHILFLKFSPELALVLAKAPVDLQAFLEVKEASLLVSTRWEAPPHQGPQGCLTLPGLQDLQDPNHLQEQLPSHLLHQGGIWRRPKLRVCAYYHSWAQTSGVKQAGPVDWGLTSCPGPQGPCEESCNTCMSE